MIDGDVGEVPASVPTEVVLGSRCLGSIMAGVEGQSVIGLVRHTSDALVRLQPAGKPHQ